MSVLTFRTKVQATLFMLELRGQLSDGLWENLPVTKHYVPWYECEVKVGENVGRDFEVPYASYCFNSKKLVSVVGDRMLLYARLARDETFDPHDDQSVQLARRLERIAHINKGTIVLDEKLINEGPVQTHYWGDDPFMIPEDEFRRLANLANDQSYSHKDLVNDLRDMRKIIKIRVS